MLHACSSTGSFDIIYCNDPPWDTFIVIRNMAFEPVNDFIICNVARNILEMQKKPVFKARVAKCKMATRIFSLPIFNSAKFTFIPLIPVEDKPCVVIAFVFFIADNLVHSIHESGRIIVCRGFESSQVVTYFISPILPEDYVNILKVIPFCLFSFGQNKIQVKLLFCVCYSFEPLHNSIYSIHSRNPAEAAVQIRFNKICITPLLIFCQTDNF